MKRTYPIKPCPWCKKTPKFHMYLSNPTWLPEFRCENSDCLVNPKSKYVPIRNTSKKNAESMRIRIEKMINRWNEHNPIEAYEGLIFDFEEIVENELKRM